MAGKILIIDDVATSRIVLKVQLSATFYDVVLADSASRGVDLAQEAGPDLVVISETVADMPIDQLCRTLRESPETAWSTIVVMTHASDRRKRAQYLAAGADDIFSRSQPDVLFLSRLRCLMRARGAEEEIRLRDSTSRELGLSEVGGTFEGPGNIYIVTRQSASALDWHNALVRLSRHQFRPMPMSEALRWTSTNQPADVFVIDMDGSERKSVMRLIADIRSRPDVRHAEVLLITADHHNPMVPDALDIGASAVMPYGFDPREVLMRVNTLLRRKKAVERLRRSLEDGLRASLTDPLTGLYNRRYVIPYLERMLSDMARSKRKFALVLGDLDHFKQVNDRFGHNAGDAVLIAVADLLRENLRAKDLVARFGGEEFLIIMPDTGWTESQLVAERLRKRMQDMPFAIPDREERLQVTMSMGGCIARMDPGQTPEQAALAMIDRADRALYIAKDAGRNQVSMVPETAG